MTNELPNPIRDFLADFIARRRRMALVKAAALAVAAGLCGMLLACTADRLLHLPGIARSILLLLDVLLVGAILYRPIRDALRPHADWTEAAAHIETLDPTFSQRLLTVTSQLTSPEHHRGSAGMLAALAAEVSLTAEHRSGAAMTGLRFIRRSLALAGCCLLVTLAALAIPWLQLPQLFARFTRPWANLPEVTTTHLLVDPGSIKWPAGRPLHVAVRAQHLTSQAVYLHWRQPDGWSQLALSSAGADHFAGDLPVDQDTTYFVTGGDARSASFAIRALTPPGLSQIKARVQYPPYLKWPDTSLVINDNHLDVPAGSEVTLSLLGTEPLSDATVLIGNTSVATTAAVDPTVRVAKVTVKRDLSAIIKLKSVDGVESSVAQPLILEAVADHPPIVHLLVPPDDLRLSPLDLLQTAGEAMDDYGVVQWSLQIKIDDRPPLIRPLKIDGDPKRIDLPIECDMANLGVSIGDLVQITLTAKDGAGQQGSSDVLRAIIAPRSLDMNGYLRMAELRTAKHLADEMTAQLQIARDQLGQSADSVAHDGDRSLQSLGSAGSAARLMKPVLLRAISRTDRTDLADAIAAWGDMDEHAVATSEVLLDERAREVDVGRLAGPLDQLRDQARRSAEQIQAVLRGQSAQAMVNDQITLADLRRRAGKADSETQRRLKLATDRLQSSLDQQTRDLGTSDTNALAALVQQGIDAARQNPPIDFAGISGQWSGAMQRVSNGNRVAMQTEILSLALAERLSAASALESVRPDADYVRARDWERAGRATKRQAAPRLLVANDQPSLLAAREFPKAMRDLQAEHAIHRLKAPPGDAKAIHDRAEIARAKMRRWAGEDDPLVASARHSGADENKNDSVNEKQAPEKAMQALEAAAAAQEKQFNRAKAIDRAATASTSPADSLKSGSGKLIADSTDTAQRIEQLRQRQEQLAAQTADAVKGADSQAEQQQRALAWEQGNLSKAIADERAQDAVASDDLDSSADKSKHVEKAIDPVTAIAQARRALAGLKKTNDDVRHAENEPSRLERARAEDSTAVEAASQNLDVAAPAAEQAKRQIDDKVVAGVRDVQQSARAKDLPNVSGRADELDRAIRQADQRLDEAEEKLADRDALAAAEAAAKDAADAMSAADNQDAPHEEASAANHDRAPADAHTATASAKASAHRAGGAADRQAGAEAAQRAQARAIAALERASDHSNAAGGQARIRNTPNIDAVLSLLPEWDLNIFGNGGAGGESGKAQAPIARDWGRLRTRDEANQTAVATPADPAGYEQVLRLYFETLGKDK